MKDQKINFWVSNELTENNRGQSFENLETKAIISLAKGNLFSLFLDEKKRFKIWDPQWIDELFALKFDNEKNKTRIENIFIEKLVHEFIDYKELRENHTIQQDSSEFQDDLKFFLGIVLQKIEAKKIDDIDKENLIEECEKLMENEYYCNFFNITSFLDKIKNWLKTDNLINIPVRTFIQAKKKFDNKQNSLLWQTRKLRKIETKLIKIIDRVNNQDYNS